MEIPASLIHRLIEALPAELASELAGIVKTRQAKNACKVAECKRKNKVTVTGNGYQKAVTVTGNGYQKAVTVTGNGYR